MEAPSAGVLLMALPPRPMGTLVDSGIDPTNTDGLPEMEVMVNMPEEF